MALILILIVRVNIEAQLESSVESGLCCSPTHAADFFLYLHLFCTVFKYLSIETIKSTSFIFPFIFLRRKTQQAV